MKRKTLFWAGLFAVLLALSVGVYLSRGGGTRAVITVDGELYRTVELSGVREAYAFTVETAWGFNTVQVSPGAIAVIDADCPGHDCIRQGAISDGAIPIVCLPHRMVIQIERADE